MSGRDRLPGGVEGHRLGTRHGELVEMLDLAAELGVSVRDLPADAVAELRAALAEQALPDDAAADGGRPR